jgi:hypothetical protein
VSAVLLSSLLCPAKAYAQVGVTGGLSSSTMVLGQPGAPSASGDRRTGFVGGVSFDTTRQIQIGLRTELLIRQAGGSSFFNAGDEIRTTYLEMPVLARLYVFGTRHAEVYLLGGPTISYLLEATYTNGAETSNLRSIMRKGDVGLSVGGGVDIGRVMLGARYTRGWVSVLGTGDGGGTLKNRSLTATAGLRFGR